MSGEAQAEESCVYDTLVCIFWVDDWIFLMLFIPWWPERLDVPPNWLLIASFHNWMSQRRFLFFGDKSRRISFEFEHKHPLNTSHSIIKSWNLIKAVGEGKHRDASGDNSAAVKRNVQSREFPWVELQFSWRRAADLPPDISTRLQKTSERRHAGRVT